MTPVEIVRISARVQALTPHKKLDPRKRIEGRKVSGVRNRDLTQVNFTRTCNLRLECHDKDKSTVEATAADNGGLRKLQEQIEQNPELSAKLNQLANDPEAQLAIQKQMEAMQNFLQQDGMREKLKALEDDPEFKEMIQEMRESGPAAIAKYWNNPEFLKKISDQVGLQARPQGHSPSQSIPNTDEVENLFDAAKANDVEAAEDLLAVGKDPSEQDAENRTPLHVCAAFNTVEVATIILDGGADVNKTDSKGNTPLHYAAGYGREEVLFLFLEKGGNAALRNSTGKTPSDLARLDERNPVGRNAELMEKLDNNIKENGIFQDV